MLVLPHRKGWHTDRQNCYLFDLEINETILYLADSNNNTQ